MRRHARLLFLFSVIGSTLLAQGLNTTASKDDWEEINFEFNSAVLTDGYPSLLRLADLLQKHADYKVNIEGHADRIGSNRYNDRLGQKRADEVKAFLLKYGAAGGQLTTGSQGKRAPKVANPSKEGRFMNRRVNLTVTDGQGKIVSAGSIGDAIKAIDPQTILDAQKKCCDDILKRLDKLDEIADLLRGMKGENDALKKELDDLRKAQADLDAYVKGQPKPLTKEETSSIVDTRTAEQIEKARMPRFSILGINAGLDQNRDLTFGARGRYFQTFKEQFALQGQGEYMYFRDRQEGQFDIGLVNRFVPRAQAGAFASFKTVSMRGMQRSGTLGEAAFTMDYLFSRGKVGLFGTKGFMNTAVINESNPIVNGTRVFNIVDQSYLSIIDQIGASTTVGLLGNTYLEGNLGYLKSRGHADRPGGTLRFVFPLSERFAFTLEGGLNETMVGRDNNGRVVAGFQFGNFMRPKDFLEGYNGNLLPVPVDVPRVRFEVLTRQRRTGNQAPVADAGPDQIGIPAGTVTLNGSGSFDPEGDPITYQWSQIAGPAVSISGMNAAIATFPAAQGETYAFRLTVKDDKGAQGIARTSVTTQQPSVQQGVQIIRFQASPTNLKPGQSSTIDWQVLNADTVTISGLGTVNAKNGTRAVSPARTTQYVLTARNRNSEATATTTITVEEQPVAQFLACSVSPANITAGESATITYATLNADNVSISGGIGAVPANGQKVVTPTETTTYTLTAANARGPVTCGVTVTVGQGSVPRIVSFTANPMSIQSGQASTLTWSVENATGVSITSLGAVQNSGTQDVKPTLTTTYVLTASNKAGQTTASTTVTVTAPPPPANAVTLSACTASPATSAKPGDPVVLSYSAVNATGLSITGATGATIAGPVTVNPTASTTYTVTATGANNTQATCTIAVTVTPAAPPTAIITGPSSVETIYRLLTIDGSLSTNPAGGPLTYFWEPLNTGAAVLDQGQAQTRVQLGGLFGDYVFKLTVRNAAGLQDSTTVTVRFRNTNPH